MAMTLIGFFGAMFCIFVMFGLAYLFVKMIEHFEKEE